MRVVSVYSPPPQPSPVKGEGAGSPPPLTGGGQEGGDARIYAHHLLSDIDSTEYTLPDNENEHPALTWAHSGLMALTGGTRPEMCPAPLAACADGALLALRALAPDNSELAGLNGSQLLSERAALMGLNRQGRTAPGGSCRLLDTADGVIAVNLARDEDWALVPAWLEIESLSGEPGEWQALESELANRSTAQCIERGRLLGLPVADSVLPDADARWFTVTARGTARTSSRLPQAPLAIDLSTLWAGPLCSHLLQRLGARVIKVESPGRPDGARRGNEDFYDLLNAGKESVVLELQSETGRAQLRGLLEQADIVIESARPRGLRQMGIEAEELVEQRSGLTWVSITGYGRDDAYSNRVAFGDDAGVAAGLSHLMKLVTGETMFVGDAIADPLAGLHAALAAWHSHTRGGGRLISVALRDVAAHCAAFDLPATLDDLKERHAAWSRMISSEDIRPPRRRRPAGKARPLGADTDSVLAELASH